MPVPKLQPDGKEYVKVRLRATGRFYGYGTQSKYATYQRAMTGNTIGLYKMFVHTDPGFAIPKSELGGRTPSYSASESNASTSLITRKRTFTYSFPSVKVRGIGIVLKQKEPGPTLLNIWMKLFLVMRLVRCSMA